MFGMHDVSLALVVAAAPHNLPLLTTIAAAFAAAWVLGLVTQRLGLSPIVGYLLAGVVIGPHTPGFVGDVALAQQLAEIGVILLMFGVGLHFKLKDLWAVKSVALPGAIGQSLAATIAAVVIFHFLGWPLRAGVMLGMAMVVGMAWSKGPVRRRLRTLTSPRPSPAACGRSTCCRCWSRGRRCGWGQRARG
jgi:hypothetical protein